MDYREHAKELLSRRKSLVSAHSAIEDELRLLETEKDTCKRIISESVGGENALYEDRLISVLADLDDCRFRKSVVERELLKIEKGLNGLNEYQRELLFAFYIDHSQYASDDLMDKWYKERSSIYRDKSRALDAFTRSVYGALQL